MSLFVMKFPSVSQRTKSFASFVRRILLCPTQTTQTLISKWCLRARVTLAKWHNSVNKHKVHIVARQHGSNKYCQCVSCDPRYYNASPRTNTRSLYYVSPIQLPIVYLAFNRVFSSIAPVQNILLYCGVLVYCKVERVS